jgi:hypothetical protein
MAVLCGAGVQWHGTRSASDGSYRRITGTEPRGPRRRRLLVCLIMSTFRIALVCGTMMATTLKTPAVAQWLNYPTPGVPKTADGRPNLKAPTPRTSDGKPDLSGLWMPQGTLVPSDTFVKGFQATGQYADIGTGREDPVPYQPWAAELIRKRIAENHKDQPDGKCLPLSPVQLHTHTSLKRVVQIPGMLIFLDERWTNFRVIHTDGRPLPVDPQPSWLGYSTAKWDGDTLVVETNGLKDDTYLDYIGSTLTSSGKMTERFRRINYGNLEIEITIDDPKAYTKPWSFTVKQAIQLNTDLLEGFCENEKDLTHLVGK